MWAIIKLNKNNEIEQLSKNSDFKNIKSLINDSSENLFVIWDSKYPDNKKEMSELMEKLYTLNSSNGIRVYPNTKIIIDKDSDKCGCPSRCFCEWDKGKCKCFIAYCNAHGCNWFPCGGKC
ncbi:hypothetical protein [Aquimarina sp. 2304DJ70-9]|uniref:hypothetical protein n=1 Tax=Aquimarina penaris TaxID=3231044 RepID=UPI003461C8AC